MNRSAESLLGMDDAQIARVLAALANKERLAILKSILKEPASAAELWNVWAWEPRARLTTT